ncbi:MAG TPA: MaoC family dehydratase [Terracidiphilus sp.]|jgi:hypothetical protein|nr:MaoC family dehydratase [Terracidiphilus sp.]
MSLAKRVFSDTDQKRFASASGDFNPIHVDALQARRTQAGAPVVHGIHLLLFALDSLAAAQPDLPALRSIRAQFSKFIYLDEPVEVVVVKQEPAGVRLNISVDDVPRAKITVSFGDAVETCPDWACGALEPVPHSAVALDCGFEEMLGRSGRLSFQMTEEESVTLFPAATHWLGARRVAALAASTPWLAWSTLACIPSMRNLRSPPAPNQAREGLLLFA